MRVILQFVQIALEMNACNQVKRLAVVNVEALTAGNIKLIELRGVTGRCRLLSLKAALQFAGNGDQQSPGFCWWALTQTAAGARRPRTCWLKPP